MQRPYDPGLGLSTFRVYTSDGLLSFILHMAAAQHVADLTVKMTTVLQIFNKSVNRTCPMSPFANHIA
jgi:hypothetical protein